MYGFWELPFLKVPVSVIKGEFYEYDFYPFPCVGITKKIG